jgi:ParB-like chromosome segregation protein Spo0J
MTDIHWRLELRAIRDLKDYYKNPRTLSQKEANDLAKSLSKFGLIDKPIVNLDNTIIGGHQRKRVLEDLGAEEIECWVPNRQLTADEVEELCIRMNRNVGSWDFEILANEFNLNDLLDWGFEEKDLELDKQEEVKPTKPKVTLEFDNNDHLEQHLEKLEELASNASVKLKVKS